MSRVLLGVTGGIAAYKACELCRLLVKEGHDEQVGAREMEVDVVARRTPRERAERLGGDEALGFGRHEWNDLVSVLDQQTTQLARLVGGDAAGHPKEDAGHTRMMPIYLA